MTGDRLAATEPGLPSVCFFFGYTKGCLIHFKQPFVRVYGGTPYCGVIILLISSNG